MASLYLEFEKDFSQLHVISDIDFSKDGPLEIYHNNVLVYSVTIPSTNYLRTTFGSRFVYTIIPIDIDLQTFADGIWHVYLAGFSKSVGAVKFECLYCGLSKMLDDKCTINDENIVCKIKAYLIVSEASVRARNFIKAKRMYDIAKMYLDPYNCNCS
jgi:hypothetical protein